MAPSLPHFSGLGTFTNLINTLCNIRNLRAKCWSSVFKLLKANDHFWVEKQNQRDPQTFQTFLYVTEKCGQWMSEQNVCLFIATTPCGFFHWNKRWKTTNRFTRGRGVNDGVVFPFLENSSKKLVSPSPPSLPSVNIIIIIKELHLHRHFWQFGMGGYQSR